MNPDLQAKLVTYLDGLEKGAAKVGEFAEREIPETIREWLMWMAIENFTLAGLCLIVAVTAAFAIRKSIKHYGAFVKSFDNSPCIMFALLALACSVPLGISSAMKGTKVLVAPRVVIVEKVAELAKGK